MAREAYDVMKKLSARTRDEFDVFGEQVAIALRNLKDKMLVVDTKHQLTNILYHAERQDLRGRPQVYGHGSPQVYGQGSPQFYGDVSPQLHPSTQQVYSAVSPDAYSAASTSAEPSPVDQATTDSLNLLDM